MRKYIFPALIVIFAVGLASYVTLTYIKQIDHHSDIVSDSNELIFTKEEEVAMGKWRNNSLDDLIKESYEGDPAGLWIIGFSHLTGYMNFPLDTESANKYFAWSGSLGFAPSLDQLRRMYTFDLQDHLLALVYLNLTVSAGHIELSKLYHKLRSQLIEAGGNKIANEIEKIAAHKKTLILHFTEKIKEQPGQFIKLLLIEGNITDEDVLFDADFWEGVQSGRLVTGNLDEWLKDNRNYCRMIKRLAQKASEKITPYHDVEDQDQ